jgi:hypothetical protein
MSNGSRTRQRAVVPYVSIAVVTGAAFAIIALLNAPGISYAIVAILAGACYTLVGMLNRRRG